MKFPVVANIKYTSAKLGLVVVFINSNSGIVVKSCIGSGFTVGEIDDTFTNVNNSEVWSLLSGAKSAFYIKKANELLEKHKSQITLFESILKEIN